MLHTQDLIDSTATAGGSAVAALRIGMQRLFVIDRDLFPGMDVAEGKEHYVAKDGADISVRLAGVVDVVGAIPAATAVDAPNAVDIADAQLGSMGAALSLAIRNSLAGVFGDLPPAWKIGGRKATSAVDR
jgi:hypothetical protein